MPGQFERLEVRHSGVEGDFSQNSGSHEARHAVRHCRDQLSPVDRPTGLP